MHYLHHNHYQIQARLLLSENPATVVHFLLLAKESQQNLLNLHSQIIEKSYHLEQQGLLLYKKLQENLAEGQHKKNCFILFNFFGL